MSWQQVVILALLIAGALGALALKSPGLANTLAGAAAGYAVHPLLEKKGKQ